jgi:mRNA interferase RelE/StbE
MNARLFALEYYDKVVKHDIPALPKTMRLRIKKAIEERLATDPVSHGKPLQYALKGHRRLRVGDYRLVYSIVPERHCVLIVAIDPRKDIYD